VKIVVTGASGGFGRNAAERLLERVPAEDLILVTRDPRKLADLRDRGIEVREGDFDRPDGLVKAFTGGERMLLISTLDVGRRAEQHGRAFDAAARAGVGHIVYTSSDGAEPGNPAVIAPDHATTENLLIECGLDYTILRDSLYAEAVVGLMAPAAVATGQFRSAAGNGRVGFITRGECVECAVEVLTGDGHANRTYRIANERNWSLPEVADLVAEACGVAVEYVDLTVAERDAELAAAGLPEHYTPGLFTVAFGASARDDIVTYEHGIREHWFGTTSRDVRTLIGRGPTPLPEVLSATRDVIMERSKLF